MNITPIRSSIRGGTDGSRLSFMGLPTPNLFAGGHNFHSILEYVAVQDMEMAVKMIVTLSQFGRLIPKKVFPLLIGQQTARFFPAGLFLFKQVERS